MTNLWNAEPVAVVAFVNSVLALVMAFGVTVTSAQTAAVLGVVNALLAILVRSRVTSPQTLQDMTPATLADAQNATQPVKETVRKLPMVLLACVLAGATFGCASARHIAVVADATFAQAVFAVDDEEFQGCQTKALESAFCEAANPKIKQALVDVKAVTAALQATPNALPKNMPSLIGNLTDIQSMLASLPQSVSKSALVLKIQEAMRLAIGVLTALAGGQ